MGKDIIIVTKILAKYLKQMSKSSLESFMAEFCKLEAPKGCNPIQREHLEGKSPMEIAEIIMKSYTKRQGPTKFRQTLKNINENQMRIDLQKELREATRTVGGKVSAVRQKQKVGAGESSKPSTSGGDIKPKIESDSTVKAQTRGGAKGRKPKKEEDSAEDVKPKKGRRQPPTESDPTVKVQTRGGAKGRKPKKEEDSAEDVKPKKGRRQPPTDKKHFVIENRNNLIKLMTHVDPVLDDLLEEELLTQEQYDIIRKKNTSQDRMRELFDNLRSWGPKDLDQFLIILKKYNPVPVKNLLEQSKRKK